MSDQPRTIVPGLWSDVFVGLLRQGFARLKTVYVDVSGNEARNTITQELLTAERNDDINVQFQYNVPYNERSADIDGDLSGTGSVTHENSMAVVNTGAGVGSAYLESRDSIRYFPGHEFASEMTGLSIPDAIGGETDTYARWGIGDVGGSGDAMAFAVIDGVFGAVFRSKGVEQFIPHTDFSEDTLDGKGPSRIDFRSDKLNLFTYRGGWYGVLPLQYGVYARGVGYITCHIIDKTNESDEPHLSNPTLPMFMEAGRTAGTGSNIQVKSASWRGGICGNTPSGTRANRTQTIEVDTVVPAGGSEIPVFSLRNNATFQGKVNHVRVRYGTVTQSSDGTKPIVIRVYNNGILTGEVWTAKNPATSVIDYDISATAYTPTEDNIGGTLLGKVDKIRVNLFAEEGDVTLAVYPGDTITMTAASDNNSDLKTFFRWIEEF